MTMRSTIVALMFCLSAARIFAAEQPAAKTESMPQAAAARDLWGSRGKPAPLPYSTLFGAQPMRSTSIHAILVDYIPAGRDFVAYIRLNFLDCRW
jgi:hypothetical protein